MKLFRSTPAKNNFTESMMPKNRREVFLDVMKLHWKGFILYGLIIFLFALPLHFITVYGDVSLVSLRLALAEAASDSERAMINSQISFMSVVLAIFRIPAFMILSVGISGLMRVVRQHAWEEIVYFRTDFPLGIKQNVKQTLLLGFAVGLGGLFTEINAVLAGASDGLFKSLLILVPSAFIIIFGIPAAAYATACIPVYGNKFSWNIRIGLGIFSKHPVKTVIALLLSFLPFVLMLIPNFICHVAGMIVGSLLSPVIMLGFFLFSYDRFDEDINKGRHDGLIGRGTYPEKKENLSKGEQR